MASGRRIISDPVRLRLDIRHLTRHHYPAGAGRVTLVMRLWPEPFAGLSVRSWDVSVNGETVQPNARAGYGERAGLWSGRVSSGDLDVVAQGRVEVENRAGVVAALTSRVDPRLFLRLTRRTAADKAVVALAKQAGDAANRLAWLHALMELVHQRVAYRSGTTNTLTTAAEALGAGEGVCQDHAHLFIAAARAQGIAARYVCGYLLTADGEAALHETHAWAEAFVDGLGWVGFDPSAAVCPTERYVRLTIGLDAVDAAPIRGMQLAGKAASMEADVRISPVSDQRAGAAPASRSQRQSQQQ